MGEILSIGRKPGLAHGTSIFDDPKAKAYLLGTIKRKSPEACKKSELINLILKSGVDLAGRVARRNPESEGGLTTKAAPVFRWPPFFMPPARLKDRLSGSCMLVRYCLASYSHF